MTVATKNGTVEIVTDEQQEAPKTTVDVTIHPPDVITLGIWQEYNIARLAAIEKYPGIDAFTAKYYGALAVIKAGYFHIDGTDKLKLLAGKSENEQRNIPLTVVGFIVRYIAVPIEDALDGAMDADFLLGL